MYPVDYLNRTLAWFRPGGDRLPDFLCIGAQRSGTTLLHQMLSDHPNVFLPPCKELHALDAMNGIEPRRWADFRRAFLTSVERRSWRAGPAASRKLAWARRFALAEKLDMNWYASLFREARPGQRAGDITPAYALLPDAAVMDVADHIPNLDVFFILRDPIDRALSGAIHACTLAAGILTPPDRDTLIAALSDPGCIARSRYRPTIERWEACLPPGRFHVMLFDDLVTDPGGTLARICATLGIAPPRRVRHDKPVNASPVTVDWPAATLRDLAVSVVDDCSWVAARFGGVTIEWARRARALTSLHP